MPSKHNTPRRKHARSPLDKAKAHEVVWSEVAPLFEAARPWLDASFVYVIGEPDDGPLKIGFSKDPIGRLRSMQTGNPRRLRIEHVLVGAMATEKLLHQFWEPHAILSAGSKGLPGSEWFKPEARKRFRPIIEDAVGFQIELLESGEQTSFAELEDVVRDAHRRNGFIPHVVAPTIQLAQGAGYVVSRRQRI
jgi:hypothetical protein